MCSVLATSLLFVDMYVALVSVADGEETFGVDVDELKNERTNSDSETALGSVAMRL